MKHWAEPYKNASSSTLEGKIFIAACYVVGCDEETGNAIGQIAFEQKTNIWHATAIYFNRLDTCQCGQCRKHHN